MRTFPRLVRGGLLAVITALSACQSFTWQRDPELGRIELFDAGQPVLAYCFADQLPEGVAPDRKRSSYVHPIYGLDGEVLTEDFPKDHYHHRGMSLMWPVMKVGDKPCDLWTIEGIRTVFREILYERTAGGRASLGVRNAWVMPELGEVADECLHLTVHAATDVGRSIDVRYEVTARSQPITLRGQTQQNKGYGGLVFRTLHDTLRKGTVMTTDKGRLGKDSLRVPFDWADLSARFPGAPGVSGVTVIPGTDHPGAPTTWMLRHYGVLNPSWPGNEEFVIQPRTPLQLRYRIYVHRGDASAGRVREVAAEWLGANGENLGDR